MCKIEKLKREDLEVCFHCGQPADDVYLFQDEIIDVCKDCLSLNEINDTSRNDELFEDNPKEMPLPVRFPPTT